MGFASGMTFWHSKTCPEMNFQHDALRHQSDVNGTMMRINKSKGPMDLSSPNKKLQRNIIHVLVFSPKLLKKLQRNVIHVLCDSLLKQLQINVIHVLFSL